MTAPALERDAPTLPLRHCSVDEYCRAVLKCRHNAFWFYQDISPIFGNFRKPFQDSEGRWWLRVRQGFAWPADLLAGFAATGRLPWRYTFFGYQHIVPEGSAANSALYINVISLPEFHFHTIKSNKRNKIKQGLKACEIRLLDRLEPALLDGMTDAWNSLVQRTGWKWPLTRQQMELRLAEILDLPGTSTIVAIDRASGRVAGFLISKTYGDTSTPDVIAANADLLHCRPNDVLNFAWLNSCVAIPGVTKASHSIKSPTTKLERFKLELGFRPQKFPAHLQARPGFLPLAQATQPLMYKRLVGEPYWEEEPTNESGEKPPEKET
jgi:hypothetical protein